MMYSLPYVMQPPSEHQKLLRVHLFRVDQACVLCRHICVFVKPVSLVKLRAELIMHVNGRSHLLLYTLKVFEPLMENICYVNCDLASSKACFTLETQAQAHSFGAFKVQNQNIQFCSELVSYGLFPFIWDFPNKSISSALVFLAMLNNFNSHFQLTPYIIDFE